jgi:hypothetical protein
MDSHPAADTRSGVERLEATIATVCGVLEGMGIADVSPESVVAAPRFYDGRVLLEKSGSFALFNGQLAVKLRFIGYPFDDVAFLSIRELCEMYLRDSYPPTPSTPLSDDDYTLRSESSRTSLAGGQKDFPICFVLGSARSGTTLLRAMLNVHPRLWSPGELHLANFGTMADRAEEINPLLRFMPIPEAAASPCGRAENL